MTTPTEHQEIERIRSEERKRHAARTLEMIYGIKVPMPWEDSLPEPEDDKNE